MYRITQYNHLSMLILSVLAQRDNVRFKQSRIAIKGHKVLTN